MKETYKIVITRKKFMHWKWRVYDSQGRSVKNNGRNDFKFMAKYSAKKYIKKQKALTANLNYNETIFYTPWIAYKRAKPYKLTVQKDRYPYNNKWRYFVYDDNKKLFTGRVNKKEKAWGVAKSLAKLHNKDKALFIKQVDGYTIEIKLVADEAYNKKWIYVIRNEKGMTIPNQRLFTSSNNKWQARWKASRELNNLKKTKKETIINYSV